MARLQISEIFASIQGESSRSGLVTTFVRTTGCPVRCVYCDTAWAFSGGRPMDVDQVLARVRALPARLVCVTGGEPLAQAATPELIRALLAEGYRVSVETSGVRPIDTVPRPASIVLDLKTPGSGVADAWLDANLAHLRPGDEVKAVLCGRDDWDWLCRLHDRQAERLDGVEWLVAAAHPLLDPAELADWLIASGRPFRLNLQLHKILWPGVDRGR